MSHQKSGTDSSLGVMTRELSLILLTGRQGAIRGRHEGRRRRRVHLRRAAYRLQDPARVLRIKLLKLLQVFIYRGSSKV